MVQRVARARVAIDGRTAGEIGPGLLVLAGFSPADQRETLEWMAGKIVGLRIFADEEGRMNRSLLEAGGELLVVSQFTLYGDVRKGRRPSFVEAAQPDLAVPLYEAFIEILRGAGCRVETGEFGASMQVELVNDGPVTLTIER